MSLIRIDWPDYSNFSRRIEKAKERIHDANREGAQRVGRIYRDKARDMSPVKSGTFASKWFYKTQVFDSGSETEVTLYNTDPKASLIIEGTEPHIIKPKNAKSLTFFPSGGGDQIFTKIVNHPGTEPNDIYSKVSKATESEVSEIFDESLRKFSDLI